VLDSILDGGKGLCATAQEFSIPYQTIQWWLKNLSAARQSKAVCFSKAGSLDGFFRASVRDWCVQLWRLLKKSFKTSREKMLIAATPAIVEDFGVRLY
jgi:hypothetical protein